jgi:ribose transport system permease protein
MKAAARFLLREPALVILLLVIAVFSGLSSRFLEAGNLINILVQSSSVGVVAAGMTFVLLVAGIDLSVGSIMYLSAVLAGKLMLSGHGVAVAFVAVLAAGALWGAANAAFVTRLGVKAFVVTLSTLYVGRGLGLWISQTRAMNLPDRLLLVGSARVAGVPLPVLVLLAVLATSHLVLTRTPFGRHVYAVGQDAPAAARAGLPVRRILATAYILSGLLAALGGAVAVAQLGAVSPTFGKDREFAAIAAAVLGGVSLFGGRGQVLPGVFLGAVLIQAVENGLVIVNADPYLYPMVMAGVIFLAILLDAARARRDTQGK